MPAFINGKFFAQRTTGVQRYARNALAALDAQLGSDATAPPWTLLVPPEAEVPALRAIEVRRLGWPARSDLHGWEQLALPRAARGGVLLNLAGSAPAWGVEKQVCVMHDAAPFDQPQAYTRVFATWYRWLFRRLARRSGTTLVTVSEFSRDRLAAALSLPSERFVIAPGGADHLHEVVADESQLAPNGLERQAFILAVGSRNPTKNLSRLVEAWRLLGRGELRLAIVGGTNARVFEGRDGLPAAQGVVDLGAVSDEVLKALYEGARGLVFPSLYEGFGLPPLEAMACSCPVTASALPSVREVCGDAALYFDPGQADRIAEALGRLADDAALRSVLRERGRERIARFAWHRTAQALRGAVEAAR